MKNYSSIFLVNACTGLFIWLLSWLIPSLGLIERLFIFAPLTIVPLALSLIIQADRNNRWPLLIQWIAWLQPFAAFSTILSYLWPQGLKAGLWASGWLVLTCLIACYGLQLILHQGLAHIEEFSIGMGLLFLPIGGLWFLASRFGFRPMGFSEVIVILTGVHFHYAGFSSPILNGLAGRFLWSRPHSKPLKHMYTLMTLSILGGIPLLALGITFSPLLELLAALVLAGSLLLLSLISLIKIIPFLTSKFSQLLMTLSALAIWLTMLCAFLFALGEYNQYVLISIPQMARLHGISNALGFVGCGLFAWHFCRPQPLSPPWGIPFSQFRGKGFIGENFFQTLNALSTTEQKPTGLIDQMTSYQQHNLNTSKIHPDIITFYEQTNSFELLVKPDWKNGFKWGGQLYHWFMSFIGQMCLPVISEKKEDLMCSQILPINDQLDGRQLVRAWIRTYSNSSKVAYVAAYSSHQYKNQRYMNIAFPLPFSNMSSILYLENMGKGLKLTTLTTPFNKGDQGVYWIFPKLPIRLPLNETIKVWSIDEETPLEREAYYMESTTIMARHDMWLFGVKFLTLDYYIYPLQKT